MTRFTVAKKTINWSNLTIINKKKNLNINKIYYSKKNKNYLIYLTEKKKKKK